MLMRLWLSATFEPVVHPLIKKQRDAHRGGDRETVVFAPARFEPRALIICSQALFRLGHRATYGV